MNPHSISWGGGLNLNKIRATSKQNVPLWRFHCPYQRATRMHGGVGRMCFTVGTVLSWLLFVAWREEQEGGPGGGLGTIYHWLGFTRGEYQGRSDSWAPHLQSKGKKKSMAAKNGLVRLSLLTFIWRPHVSARVIFVNVRGEIGNVARSLAREDQGEAAADLLPKTCSNSLRMSSTAWFWKTMFTAMLPLSHSGRSSVGPKTMPMFCVVMRLASECSKTLRDIHKKKFAFIWIGFIGLMNCYIYCLIVVFFLKNATFANTFVLICHFNIFLMLSNSTKIDFLWFPINVLFFIAMFTISLQFKHIH